METESRATDRLTLFSDAVVAIAITLLAIDLPVPEGVTVEEFWGAVRHNDGHYAAFLISFFAIAAAWRDHHEIFRYVRRVDSRLRTLNTIWLLMIVLNPFATKLLTAPGQPDLDTHALRFGFYALLQVLESGTVFAMLAHMLSHGLAPRTPRTTAIDVARQSFNLILGFGLSIPVFFVTTNAWVMWIVVPLLVSRWNHIRRRRRDRAAGPPPGGAPSGGPPPGGASPDEPAPG
jgi:TMEM175 potassium channel family protein